MPRLAGQKQEFARVHGEMNAGAMKFSSEQIEALAARTTPELVLRTVAAADASGTKVFEIAAREP